MEDMVRIEKIEINGIKNVNHGDIVFQEYSNILKGNFSDFKSVLGIYGQNGSGKTTVLETTQILKDILSGSKIPDSIGQYISNETNRAEITFTFFIKLGISKKLVFYTFYIDKNDDGQYDIVYEKLTSKEYDDISGKWKSLISLFEVSNNEIILKKLRNVLSMETMIGLSVAKEIEVGTSLVFNARNRILLVKELTGKDDDLVRILNLLNFFATSCLIVIENDLMGSINLNSRVPINVYFAHENMVSLGEIVINLMDSNVLPVDVYNDFEKIIEQIDIVLSSIVPNLNLKIINKKDQLLESGKKGISFEVVSSRDDKYIPLKYESEGIKRILSVTSSLIAAFNSRSICLMIDEFDSGIYEYLLGEILEIFEESAKGQFVFTSHNLRPLEKLSYKSIVFTTTNTDNRYIQLSGVKPNNNIRDFYYTNIMLGGQSEVIYEETKNYKIKRAFRKAGELYE